MGLLIASVLALLVAPLLDRAMTGRPSAPAALDGFVVVAISGVLAHIFPHALEEAGWVALPAGIVGLVLPTLLHRISEKRSHIIVVVLVLLGLGGHAFLDGVGLAQHDPTGERVVAWAVVLHRVPDGLAIWWLVRPKRGFAAATCLLIAIAGATIAGFHAHALADLPRGIDVPILALLGVPSYVCAAGATPLMAVLRHKGLSAGAAIAFLLTGPATNLTTLGMLARIHGRRTVAVFALVVSGSAIALGFAVNALLPDAPAMPLHGAAAEASGVFSSACLLVLTLVGVASLFRQGVRGFLAQVIGGEHGHAPSPSEMQAHSHGEPVPTES